MEPKMNLQMDDIVTVPWPKEGAVEDCICPVRKAELVTCLLEVSAARAALAMFPRQSKYSGGATECSHTVSRIQLY